MGKIFIVLGIGFLIGFRGILGEKALKLNGKLQTLWLMLLIFSMGVGIGADKEVIGNLGTLGGQALVYALLSVVGSVLCVFGLSKLYLVKGDKK